ncbi:thiol-disulfide oxidoreductase [Solemya pervernicosa gill symbiont]|uniref:Thiol-disulfide oxidoreductase n=2 Tax=Gammaproteobacteria incertae sedis TaxID=118884 RepID=A0A1T2L8L0_9GAMM|nr:TlpA disulfide reductase family protein [Candidatus Reidiella endopervernicosa]OOZ41400.1 thiol-disulfide oxidoreductase [Solemya pervernicosa gill symbiont]
MRRILTLILLLFTPSLFAADAADFALQGVDGKIHKLSDYRGKWVVVNFWATWCPPCLEEIPELIGYHDKHKDNDSVVLGINFEQIDSDRLGSFVDDQLISYPVLLTNNKPVKSFEPLKGLPTTFVVSPEGKVVGSYLGGIEAQMLEQFIEDEKRDREERS